VKRLTEVQAMLLALSLSLSLSLSTFKCISSYATKQEFHVLTYTQKGGLVFMHISMEE
jgi:hypothetical protein